MSTRATDTEVVKPTRTVPLASLVPVVVLIVGNALLMWRGQAESEVDRRHQTEKITELIVEVKSVRAAMDAKNQIDAQQSADNRDLERRMTRVETSVNRLESQR